MLSEAPTIARSNRLLSYGYVALIGCCLGKAVLAQAPAHGPAQMSGMMGNNVRTMIAFDRLEWSASGDRRGAWRGEVWSGTDLNKFWLKTEGELAARDTEASEIELLYSHAIRPFWDLQAGVRHESRPAPDQDWAIVGVQGLAPYWFDVEASLAFAGDGQWRLNARAGYELLLTQRLILEPDAEITFFARDEPGRFIGSGLSAFEIGLRLRYEIKREVAPYVGIVRRAYVGSAADRIAGSGGSPRETELVVGVRVWY